jgi:hypothetical protein
MVHGLATRMTDGSHANGNAFSRGFNRLAFANGQRLGDGCSAEMASPWAVANINTS